MEFTSFRKEKVFKRGRGGGDPQHLEDEALFHELLKRHEEIERITTISDNGIEVKTIITSGDLKLVKTLQDHALGMKKRFDSGRAIRSWDPLFIELFDHKDEIKLSAQMLENGIKVSLSSEDPRIRDLINRHDETLHAFIRYGFEAAQHESPYRPK
ncbi:MAG: hypothetical protein IE885_03470 [Campylobacterales bacterium]|nr:hypothetical protein [Campylobacterales bacterium]